MCEIKKRWPPVDTIPAVTINAIAMPEGTGRWPHVRLSVHGPKTMGAPDFLSRGSPTSACAAFIKQSRMEFANAHKIHRKSGGSRRMLLLHRRTKSQARAAALQTPFNLCTVTLPWYLPISIFPGDSSVPKGRRAWSLQNRAIFLIPRADPPGCNARGQTSSSMESTPR